MWIHHDYKENSEISYIAELIHFLTKRYTIHMQNIKYVQLHLQGNIIQRPFYKVQEQFHEWIFQEISKKIRQLFRLTWKVNPLSQTIGGISYVGCFAPNWLLGRKEWHCELEIMQNILYRRTLYRCASLNSKRNSILQHPVLFVFEYFL